MKKELKDYLHLYLGCECLLESAADSKEPNIKTLRSIPFLFGEHHAEFGDNTAYTFSEIKPILRPLSDMTEEEKTEYDAIYGDTVIDTIIARTYNLASPEKFRYLLSKHFDLFGLIDAGLAIDKTTLNPN